ncbi:MAG: (d)CMP kinase, partial [Alphaproteobacteria bacterium]
MPHTTTTQTNPLKGHVVTIDGPSASGKGTLAKRLSRIYRMKYLDTGTLYRTVVLAALRQGVSLTDTAAVAEVGRTMNFDFKHIGNNHFSTFLDGEDVEAAIRTPEVDKGIPLTAPEPAIRQALFDRQHQFALTWKDVYGVLLDGRDCGARIFPEASVKFFIVGDVAERARRRIVQLQEAGLTVNATDIEADMRKRDQRDAPNTLQTPD